MDRDEPTDFAAFVAARSTRLLRTAVLLSGGDRHRGEDLLQTALTRAYSAWPRISSDDPEAYVRRILVNLATDWWRSPLSRDRPTSISPPERPAPDVAEETLAERDELRRALERLSARERSALVLRFYWDLSEQQVASELGWPVGTVKSTTARAIDKVRHILTKPTVPHPERGST